MSILGYSSSYFLPEYWADTPLYGEKIIPLIDYLLSNEYEESDKMAKAYYRMQNKYKNPFDLPIENIKELIDEFGYEYVRVLLGNNESTIRLLFSILGLVHQLKGTKSGLSLVLNLLKGNRNNENILIFNVYGNPIIHDNKVIGSITIDDYVYFRQFTIASSSEVRFQMGFSVSNLISKQCICSVIDKSIRILINTQGQLELYLGSNKETWNIANGEGSARSTKRVERNHNYQMQLLYDGYEYRIAVSDNGKPFENWIVHSSSEKLEIYSSILYMGIDNSEGTLQYPISGEVDFAYLDLGTNNVEITQWFEQNPVGEENTFLLSTEMDIDVVTTEFFTNFSNFVKNYVYPTLEYFTAKMKLKSTLTFLMYAKQHFIYNSYSDVDRYGYLRTSDDKVFQVEGATEEEHEPLLVPSVIRQEEQE